jgi:hypothetical protein
MSSKPVTVGRWNFKSEAAAERYIRALFTRWPLPNLRNGTYSAPLTGDDCEFALGLIDMHPSKKRINGEDSGTSIRSIHIQRPEEAGRDERQRRFFVRLQDSDRQVFSWSNSIDPKAHPQKIYDAMRRLIAPQKEAFRAQHFAGYCTIEDCGKPLTKADVRIDHAFPDTFESLVADWLRSVHITVYEIELRKGRRFREPSQFADPFLAQQWIEFHEMHARLRCVCQDCNGSKLVKLANQAEINASLTEANLEPQK